MKKLKELAFVTAVYGGMFLTFMLWLAVILAQVAILCAGAYLMWMAAINLF